MCHPVLKRAPRPQLQVQGQAVLLFFTVTCGHNVLAIIIVLPFLIQLVLMVFSTMESVFAERETANEM